MHLHRFCVDDLVATPWKNGGGVTREIVCQPTPADPGMSDFDWRVSIAHIAQDGPFSAFPGVDRIITLLSGGGVHLHSADAALDHLLDTPLAPFAFAGELPIHARLLAGDCHDFNVMTRRAVCSAALDVVRGPCDWSATTAGLLLAVQGDWQLEGDPAQTLQARQGLWWNQACPAWRLQPQGEQPALLALSLHFQ